MAYSKSVILSSIVKSAEQLGYSCLSPEQQEVVFNFVSGRDVFVSLPTGAGKSLCYLLLPFTFNLLRNSNSSIVIVVSPLKSLMEDQVAKASGLGLKCVYLSQGDKCNDELVQAVLVGEYQIIFVSPEVLLTELRWREMLRTDVYQNNLVGVIVDEAHCVETWGEKFRVEFANISEVRSLIPKSTRIMALTATATVTMRRVILSTLDMKGCYLVIRDPNKINIKYSVFKQGRLDDIILPIVDDISSNGVKADRTIIFCRTYVDTLEVFKGLVCCLGRRDALYAQCLNPPSDCIPVNKLRMCEKYDGSTATDNQQHIVKSFTQVDGVVRVVVATIAFGMGLDSPNVRRIIHWGAPDKIAMYVQETGRGGRDGKLCNAELYYNRLTCSSTMNDYCKNSSKCRREVLMAVFTDNSEIAKPSPLHVCCDICANQCTCVDCKTTESIPEELIPELVSFDEFTNHDTSIIHVQHRLHEQLLQYRCSICPSNQSTASLMVGKELLSGLSDLLIKNIVDRSQDIKSVGDLIDLGVGSDSVACDILNLIDNL